MPEETTPDRPPPRPRHAKRGPRLLRRLQKLRRAQNRLYAVELETVAELIHEAEEPTTVPQELALALAVGRHAAENEVALATALTTRLPETMNALRRGDIDGYKASKVHEPTVLLTDEQAREVDAVMATRLTGKDPGSI